MMNHRYRTHALLHAAAAVTAATLLAPVALAATVDGTVSVGEYGAALVSQNTPTGFGNNLSELNQAFANYTPGGHLELALTGNLEGNGNGLVIFIDSKAGGGIANSVPGGFGQFGSFGGAKVDDWGTDVDGSAGVTATPGGGSIVSPNFNPDYAIEIAGSGGPYPTSYSINIIDLTLPNEPSDNRDVFLGNNTVDGPSATQTYLRDAGFTDAGDITHAFNNTNTAGVNAFDFATPPGALGDPATATTGFEFLFENQFLAHTPGHALRIMPLVSNGGGDYLSNQFLPGVNGDTNLQQAGAGPGGTPLFDGRFYGDQFYIPLFVPTSDGTGGGTWETATWSGGVAPNGAEHAARLVGTVATPIGLGSLTLGYFELSNPNGFTLSGPLSLNGGAGAAAMFVTAGSHTFTGFVNMPTDVRVNAAQDASATFVTGMSLADNKALTKTGSGALTISGNVQNGPGSSLAVDAGTVTLNSNFGAGPAAPADRADIFASTPGGGSGATVVVNVNQTLGELAANPDGLVQVSAGSNKVIVAHTVSANGTGKIDLKDNKLITTRAAGTWDGGANAYTEVAGLVDAGRGSAGNAAWDGSGIVTSDTRAINNGDLVSIGVAKVSEVRPVADTATTTFAGQTVLGSDTLVMATWGGDANLDGKINIDDYGRIDGNVGQSGTVFGWSRGDFNYDGKINIDDYGIIDGNINRQGTPFSTAGAVEGVAAVPEPALLSIGAPGTIALLRRRRRA